MLMRSDRKPGFTIVELLIVIVVIAILATISIVAYTGIQTRAENQKTAVAMSQYAKAMQLYALDNGTYPIEAGWPCFGAHPGTTCAAVDGSTPATCNGFGATSSGSAFSTKMKAVLGGTLPQPSTQRMDCGGKLHSGAWYHSVDGISVEIEYLFRGNEQCNVGGYVLVQRTQITDTTVCRVTPPAL